MPLMNFLFGSPAPAPSKPATPAPAKPAGVPSVLDVDVDVSEWRNPATNTRVIDCFQIAAQGWPSAGIRIRAQFEELAKLNTAELRAECWRLTQLAHGQGGSIVNQVAYVRMMQVQLIRDVRTTYGDAVELRIVTGDSTERVPVARGSLATVAATATPQLATLRIADQRPVMLAAPRERSLNSAGCADA